MSGNGDETKIASMMGGGSGMGGTDPRPIEARRIVTAERACENFALWSRLCEQEPDLTDDEWKIRETALALAEKYLAEWEWLRAGSQA